MARQNINVNPAEKLFEVYNDFSGGINKELANERMKNNEFPVLQNVDLSGRGSLKRRSGRVRLAGVEGNGQGAFWFYRSDLQEPDLILAISGKLYRIREVEGSTWADYIGYKGRHFPGVYKDDLRYSFELVQIEIDDDGDNFEFQEELPIEAVQYRDTMFFATGTKLVEMTYHENENTFNAKVVEPYKPTVQEVINIGTNSLAEDPATWIQDKKGSTVSIEGITPSSPQGQVGEPVRFTAHIKKPDAIQVGYRFSYRQSGDSSFEVVPGLASRNYRDITFDEVGEYDIRIETLERRVDIETWNTTVSGWNNGMKGTEQDAAAGEGCLILQGSGTNPDDPSLKAWRDYSSPIDMSIGDRVEWSWTTYSSDTQNGNDPGAVEIKFYTEGNLTEPVLTLTNDGGRGRALYNDGNDEPVPIPSGTAWNREENEYDGDKTGLDKIVRIGISGGQVSTSGVYIPNDQGYNFDPDDTTTRIDELRIWKSGTQDSYTISNYEVVGVLDPDKNPETYEAIQTSRMIRLHWDHILLGKDSKYPGQIYVSDMNNPRYFPTDHVFDFSLDRREAVTAVVRFQNYLTVFTKTATYTITGKQSLPDLPDPFSIAMIHDSIGCVAGETAQVIDNSIVFLSDEGVYRLLPNPYRLDAMSVQRIDHGIRSEVHSDSNACSIVHDNQYFLCYPDRELMYRLYYESGAWVEDRSTKLNVAQFLKYGDLLYEITQNGDLQEHNDDVFSDVGEAYTMIVETKAYDLSSTFNFKKVRRLYIMASGENTDLYLTVKADSGVIYQPTTGKAIVNPDGVVEWVSKTEPNLTMYAGTKFSRWIMGHSPFGEQDVTVERVSVRGKCRRVQIRYEHKQSDKCEVFGFGIEFKMKRL